MRVASCELRVASRVLRLRILRNKETIKKTQNGLEPEASIQCPQQKLIFDSSGQTDAKADFSSLAQFFFTFLLLVIYLVTDCL